jgi:TolB protein
MMPAWSPDGTKIAFARSVDIDVYDVYVVNPDGSGLTRLTQPVANTVATNYRPAWSPDGTHILFWSDRDDNSSYGALYLMNVDGSGPVKVTRDDFFVEGTPAWTH